MLPHRLCRLDTLLLSAMKQVISKFGAYTNHITTLSEDSSVKSTDHAKLKGYYSKWTTYAATLRKCTEDEHTAYQCQQLKKFSEARSNYSSKYEEYCQCKPLHQVQAFLV